MLRSSPCALLLPAVELAVVVALAHAVAFGVTLLPADASASTRCSDFEGTPTLERFLPYGSVDDLQVRDGVAYLIDGRADRLVTLDTSDPRRPVPLGELEITEIGREFTLHGTTLYMPVHYLGIHIVDVSDPARPTLVRTMDWRPQVRTIAVVGDTMYAMGRDTLLGAVTYVFDVRDPHEPDYVKLVFPSGPFRELVREGAVIEGDLMAAIGSRTVLLLHDVGMPRSPRLVGSIQIDDNIEDVHLREGHAVVVGTRTGIVVFDVKDPTAPLEVARLANEHVSWRLGLGETMAVMGDGERGTKFVDMSDLTRPQLVGEIASLSAYGRPLVFGDVAWLPTYEDGVAVVVPGGLAPMPTTEGFVSRGDLGAMSSLVRDGDQLVVATHPGLVVIDGRTGERVGTHVNQGHSDEVVLHRGHALLAAGYDGLQIIDLRDPTAPRQVRRLYTVGQSGYVNSVTDAALVDDVAFVSTQYDNGGEVGAQLYVVDVSDPSRAHVLRTFPTPYSSDVVSHKTSVYVAHGQITTLDASDPRDPRVIAVTEKLQHVRYLAVGEDALYAASTNTRTGTYLYGFSRKPSGRLELRSTGQVSDIVEALFLHDDVLYVGTRAAGVEVFDVSDAGAPVRLGWIRTSDPEEDAWVLALQEYQGKLLVGTDWTGIRRGKLACSGAPTPPPDDPPDDPEEPEVDEAGPSIHIWPNPANPRAVVRLVPKVAGPARVTVLDLRGRRVRTLVDGWLSAEPRTLVWSGVDDAGAPVASGVYLLDVRTEEGRTRGRIVLVR